MEYIYSRKMQRHTLEILTGSTFIDPTAYVDYVYILYCAGDKFEKNEMSEACSAYVGGERRVQGFVGET
jgi:hypothetical protein